MLGQPNPNQSIIGTEFIGEILAEKQMRDRVAIVPAVTGRAYFIGLHKLVIDDEDPSKKGGARRRPWKSSPILR